MFKTKYEELINSNVSDSKDKDDKEYIKEEKSQVHRGKLPNLKDKATLLADSKPIIAPKSIEPTIIPHTPWREHPLNPRRR